jgi:hypothetical protein
MTSLALGDEHPPGGDLQVFQPQPEDLAAAQSAEHHRLGHGSVPVRAQRREQRIDLIWLQDPRQGARGPHQRNTLPGTLAFPAGGQTARHRVRLDVTAGLQEREQPGHARQPPPHRPGRYPTVADGLQPLGRATGVLRGHEREHVRRDDPARCLADDGEEHLQVIRDRNHRVRP